MLDIKDYPEEVNSKVGQVGLLKNFQSFIFQSRVPVVVFRCEFRGQTWISPMHWLKMGCARVTYLQWAIGTCQSAIGMRFLIGIIIFAANKKDLSHSFIHFQSWKEWVFMLILADLKSFTSNSSLSSIVTLLVDTQMPRVSLVSKLRT